MMIDIGDVGELIGGAWSFKDVGTRTDGARRSSGQKVQKVTGITPAKCSETVKCPSQTTDVLELCL